MRKANGGQGRGKPFNPKDYEKGNITAEEVMEIKEAFDLFDF